MDEPENVQNVENVVTDLIELYDINIDKDAHIGLNCNVYTGRLLPVVVQHLCKNPWLTSLNMDSCDINDKDMVSVCTLVRNSNTLRTLSLQYNSFTDHGAVELARALLVNTSIETIDLRYNAHVDMDGIVTLTDALKINTTVKAFHYSIQGGRFEKSYSPDEVTRTCQSVASMLTHNSCLQTLDWINHDDLDANTIIVDALTINQTLTSIYIEPGNVWYARMKMGAYAKAWMPVWICNTSLRVAHIYFNHIKKDVLECMLQGLQVNTTLTYLLCPNSEPARLMDPRRQRYTTDAHDVLAKVLDLNYTLAIANVAKYTLEEDVYKLIRTIISSGNVSFMYLAVHDAERSSNQSALLDRASLSLLYCHV